MEIKNEYEQLLETVPCGILQLRMPVAELCHVVRINKRAVEILNLYPDQLESNTLWAPDHMDEQNRRIASSVLANIRTPGERGTFLLQLYRGTVQGEAQLLEQAGEKVLQLIFMEIGSEIAVRRREAEQAELLESVLQSVRCGVVRFGFCDDEQRIILVNRTGWKMLDFESEDQCKEQGLDGFLAKVHPEDRKALLRTHCTLREHNGKNTCEFRLYDREGRLRWLSAEEQQLRDAHGNDIIQMTMMDITDQKLQMEKKDAENGEIIQSLGKMYFMILYVEVRSDLYRVVKSAFPLPKEQSSTYSRSMENAVRRICRDNREKEQMCRDYMDLLSLERFQQRFQENTLLWEQDFISGEKENADYYRVEAVMSGSGGTLQHIVMGLRNVTGLRRKEMQEQEALQSAYEAASQASRAKTEFLSRMSHDIRTPMNAIVGLTQIMKKHILEPERMKDYLGKVEDSSQLLLELINDVLDMSRVESGKIVLEEQVLDLNSVVDKIQVIIQPEMQKHRHRFQVDNRLPAQLLRGDGLRFQQIVLNILSNCVKFTADGGRITWSLWAEPLLNGKYQNTHMKITDNGIGMTPEFLDRIYQPFEREEREDTLPIQGSGLGMTIVRNLVQLMNGWIEIRSTVGEGSSFHIMLPLLADEHHSGTEPEVCKEKKSGKPDLRGRRILLTEDNKINRLIAGELLKDTGAILEEAENGRQAVEYFRNHAAGYYDLIFMDIRMPVMNGYEAAKEIRSTGRPDAAVIPIIAMTANAFSEDVQEALAAGMNDHLAKPVQVELLYQVLQSYLGSGKEKGGEAEDAAL